MELLTLKEMCELLNVSRRSIQCYEKAGLMMPTDKNKYGHLLYDEKAYQRAKQIKFLQQLGFKLREIKELIDAPGIILKNALKRRVAELESENERLDELIKEAYKLMEQLK